MDLDQLISEPLGSHADMIRLHAQERPHHCAVILDETTLDYAELDRWMDAVAAGLQLEQLGPGDIVAICAGTSINYLLAILGCVRAGVAFSPLTSSTTAANRNAMVENARARLLFLDKEAAEDWPAPSRSSVPRVALDDSEAGTRWTDWLSASAGTRPGAVELGAELPFNLIYSSGTTGVPKGIAQPWRMRWSQVRRARQVGYGSDSVTLAATPLYSNTTLVSVLPTLALGGTVIMMRKFDVKNYLELAQRHRATHSMLVPVQYQRLMDSPDFNNYDLSSLRTRFSAGAPFAAALKAEVLRRWPGALTEYYGMTEGGGRSELEAHLHPDKLHTVGKPPPDNDIRLIDDQGREVPPGETGEIVGHSPAMMSGYYRNPEQTREMEWLDADGKRFIRTGDVGRFDKDGFLVLVGRKKDMIISGGFNIYPSDIENELCQHPAVAECAVVGVPSRQWGETPVAFVVLHTETASPSDSDIKQWLNQRVGKTQRVADLRLVDKLPRNELGKVLKRDLVNSYSEQPN